MELVKGYLRGTHGKTQVCDTQLKFSPQALQDLQVSLDQSPVLRKVELKWQFSFKIKWHLKPGFEFFPLFESET